MPKMYYPVLPTLNTKIKIFPVGFQKIYVKSIFTYRTSKLSIFLILDILIIHESQSDQNSERLKL